MSPSGQRASRADRVFEMLPVLAALVVHGSAHERLWLVAPLGALLAWVAWKDVQPKHTTALLLASGATLAVVAGALQLAGAFPELPQRPFPPSVLGPLTAFVAGLAVFCAASRSAMYAWTYGWILAVLSAFGSPGPVLTASLVALLISTLAVAFAQAGLLRRARAEQLAVVLFSGLLAIASVGLARLVHKSEGWLMQAVARMVREPRLPGGIGLEQYMRLRPRSKVERSMRPLMEITGSVPERLRTTVLDVFDGHAWTPARGRPIAAAPRPDLAEARLLLFEELAPYLPTPAGTRFVDARDVVGYPSGLWRIPPPTKAKIVKLQREADEQLDREAPPGKRTTYVPEEIERPLRRHAQAIGGAGTDREVVRRIEAHFRDGFLYSLETDLQQRGRHPLLVLIEERKPAYCVYFAGAMAALVRARGIPARLVGGFTVAEVNGLSGAAIVRERDAHAWVEVFLRDGSDGRGRWVPFDPTPWRSRDEQLGIEREPGFFAQLWDALVGLARRAVARPVEALTDAAPWLLVPLVSFMAVRWFRARRGPRTEKGRAAAAALDPRLSRSRLAFHRLLRKRAAIEPLPAETDDELLDRLARVRGSEAAAAAGKFVGAWREARFRGTPFDERAAADALASLDAALRRDRAA